jgi:hypothetical protein
LPFLLVNTIVSSAIFLIRACDIRSTPALSIWTYAKNWIAFFRGWWCAVTDESIKEEESIIADGLQVNCSKARQLL